MKQKLSCNFIRINSEKEDFYMFRAIIEIFIEIFRQIKQSTKNFLINKISTRFLGLEFKSNNIIKSKALKYIFKKNIARLYVTLLGFTSYKNNRKVLCQL